MGSLTKLTEVEYATIIGSLLGDGCMERNGRNVRLKIGHGLSQREYLEWKHSVLLRLAAGQTRFVPGAIHKKTGIRYSRVEFATRSLELFEEIWTTFYRSGNKRIPCNIAELLHSPLSLAIWFMDDGYRRNDCNALRINTDAFSLDEQLLLVDAMKTNFAISCKIHKKGKFLNLYIPVSETKKFRETISQYIIASMRYKLPMTP